MKYTNEYQERVDEIAAELLRSRATDEMLEHERYDVLGVVFDFYRVCEWDESADYSDCVDKNGELNSTGLGLVDMWAGFVQDAINDALDAMEEDGIDVAAFKARRQGETQ